MTQEKVLYIIYSGDRNAIGGHFRSLRLIFTELVRAGAIGADSAIVNIGCVSSPVLRDLSSYIFIKTHAFLLFSLIGLTREKRPTVIHAFDEASLCYARVLSFLFRIRILYTKCGGENLKAYAETPTVFFSRENFNDRAKKTGGESYYVPNRMARMAAPEINGEQRNLLDFEEDTYNILRIGRFVPNYLKTFQGSIRLASMLHAQGMPVRLYLVGKVTDVAVYEQLVAAAPEYVRFIQDSRITDDAKQIIPQFHAVIGTGRSVYEACSFGTPVLCPTRSGFPALLNRENIDEFFYYNFSERCPVEVDETLEARHIEATFRDAVMYQSAKDFARQAFTDFFDIQSVLATYQGIYHNLKQVTRFRDFWTVKSFDLFLYTLKKHIKEHPKFHVRK